jgi:hypothetical protein
MFPLRWTESGLLGPQRRHFTLPPHSGPPCPRPWYTSTQPQEHANARSLCNSIITRLLVFVRSWLGLVQPVPIPTPWSVALPSKQEKVSTEFISLALVQSSRLCVLRPVSNRSAYIRDYSSALRTPKRSASASRSARVIPSNFRLTLIRCCRYAGGEVKADKWVALWVGVWGQRPVPY